MALSKPLNYLQSCVRWLWIVLVTAACVLHAQMLAPFTPRRKRQEIYARRAHLWARLLLAGMRCSLEGANNIPRDSRVLFASNHQSFIDIPLFHALMPVTFRWIAKRAFFSWPLIGRALRNMKGIEIDPGGQAAVRRSWEEAVEALRAGHNLVIFPEGTWGDREGRMLPFQRGVIRIAREADVPVVPVTIIGANRVNPPRTKEIHRGAMRMIVHPPLWPDSWRDVSDEDWLALLRERIAENLDHGTAPPGRTS